MVAENKRIHVFYIGNVQGVGFRFTVDRLARNLGLTGWVKNLPDRKVELICEGEEKVLHRILQRIDDEFSGHIRRKNVKWLPASGNFTRFEVRFF